jgi:hypothetical protein
MAIKDTHNVVDFQFIDDDRCLRPLIEAVGDSDSDEIRKQEQELRYELSTLFINAGWEGDGDIGCIFVAPCFCGAEDGWCRVVFHVKQSNNGTSWLAIPNGMRLSLPKAIFAK